MTEDNYVQVKKIESMYSQLYPTVKSEIRFCDSNEYNTSAWSYEYSIKLTTSMLLPFSYFSDKKIQFVHMETCKFNGIVKFMHIYEWFLLIIFYEIKTDINCIAIIYHDKFMYAVVPLFMTYLLIYRKGIVNCSEANNIQIEKRGIGSRKSLHFEAQTEILWEFSSRELSPWELSSRQKKLLFVTFCPSSDNAMGDNSFFTLWMT